MLVIKGRIFVTGDCHGDLSKIIKFINKCELGNDSNIIVLGDMGLLWRYDKKDFYDNCKFYEDNCNGVNLYWIDGNHENFNLINKLENNQCSKHIFYIPRGTQAYLETMVGLKKGLFIGGADSIDKYRRVPELSWWDQEQITKENIESITGHFDYVFSHCCPRDIFEHNKIYLCTLTNIKMNLPEEFHISENMLQELKNNISFNYWWFGHYHNDVRLDNGFRCFLNDFYEI